MRKEDMFSNGNVTLKQTTEKQYKNNHSQKRVIQNKVNEMLNSEERYRRLFESARDGILILDAYTGQIVDVNPFLIEILGYSYDEFLGKELWEIGIFKNIDDSKAAFIELQTNGYMRFENMPLETKNGMQINVEYVSNVYFVDNTKVIQCNIRDITERRRIEEALKDSETRLRELNATKDKFFSIIAHDLRSPFSSIIGLSELLTEKMHNKDYEGIEEYTAIIQNSSWRAMDLLTNLTVWARLQTGRMEFKPEYIEIVSIINEVTELSKDFARQKSLTISMEVPALIKVHGDKAMVSSVLRNLISNAIKFTNPGGEIVISTKQNEKELTVIIRDNGVGIKKKALEKLFLIESGISTPGTQEEQGTGLGLILCNDFVQKHGGKIWVESEVGKGSIFKFTLPVS
jgi:PAS domain S-box-containing protein